MPTAQDSFTALMGVQEPLLPELERFYRERPFPAICHPLVYSVPHSAPLNAVVNASFRAKREAAAAAKAEGAFSRYIGLHERPYQLNAFLQIADQLADADYWRMLRGLYQSTENVEELPRLWRQALLAKREQRSAMMDVGEVGFLAKLPDELTIWRGATDEKELRSGFGWSLSDKVARWFALRNPSAHPLLAEGVVSKARVLAYLGTRDEEEIVVAYEHVAQVRLQYL